MNYAAMLDWLTAMNIPISANRSATGRSQYFLSAARKLHSSMSTRRLDMPVKTSGGSELFLCSVPAATSMRRTFDSAQGDPAPPTAEEDREASQERRRWSSSQSGHSI